MLKGVVHHALLVAIIVIALMLVYSAMLKFLDPMWANQFAVWGYGEAFLYGVAAYEIGVAIAIFAKPTRLFGLIGVIILMLGALYTHLSNYEYQEIYVALFLIVLSTSCMALMWLERRLEADEKL